MRCPFCAEEIQAGAKLCRYCKSSITQADKLGYPTFYKHVALHGMSYESLLQDWASHVLGDNCAFRFLDLRHPVLVNGDREEWRLDWKYVCAITEAFGERWDEIEENSAEKRLMKAYIWYSRDFHPISILHPNHVGKEYWDGQRKDLIKLQEHLSYVGQEADSFRKRIERDLIDVQSRLGESAANPAK